MKKLLLSALGAVLLAAAFCAGSWYAGRHAAPGAATAGRKVLYYVDPMNPAHTSDRPGFAPCGMKMEPVYADQAISQATSPGGLTNLAPGTVRLTAEKQQLIGVQVGTVEKHPCQSVLRLLGRVTVDETRLYRINAAVGGWITKAPPISTWSQVQSNEVLGQMYSPEFLPAAQALLFALDARNRADATEREAAGHESEELALVQRSGRAARVSQFNLNIKQYVDSLRNLGMGEPQVQEMIRTRKFTENFDIFAPAAGFITARNISTGQRFERGVELFRIADLSRMWILADLFEKDAPSIKPGAPARVTLPHQQRIFGATVSQTLPEFDATSRTLKLRLELDNPDYVLKPDMFVDVEFPTTTEEQVTVPVAAVLDSGLRKVVFVEREQGVFEPRRIETGQQSGDLVQVLEGLTTGERVAVSGNFLLDSESRMKLAAAGVLGTPSQDPVCGMGVDEQKARAARRVSEFQGRTYCFCSDTCKRAFDANPAKSLNKASPPQKDRPAPPTGLRVTAGNRIAQTSTLSANPTHPTVRDPVCGMTVNVDEAKAANRFKPYMVQTYYFCSATCKQTFEMNPAKYVENALHGYRIAPPAAMPAASALAQVRDPVCGMNVDDEAAKAAKRASEFQGKTYSFCNDACKQAFDKDPAKFAKHAAAKPDEAAPMPVNPAGMKVNH